jgi:hypothetical protein
MNRKGTKLSDSSQDFTSHTLPCEYPERKAIELKDLETSKTWQMQGVHEIDRFCWHSHQLDHPVEWAREGFKLDQLRQIEIKELIGMKFASPSK